MQGGPATDPELGASAVEEPLLQEHAQQGSAIPTQKQPGEHWTRSVARTLHVTLSNLGTSLFFGLLTAFALKTIGQSVAIALVLLFIGMQVLAYYGFVNFNWSYVGTAVARRLDLNRDGKMNFLDVGVACKRLGGWALSWGVPSLSGFVVGFWLGWKLL